MARRSLAQMVRDVLEEQDCQQASVRRIARELDWDETKVVRVVNSPAASDLRLSRGPGGVVRYRGSERYGANGTYHDVRRVLEDYWAPNDRLRVLSVTDTSRSGRRSGGSWTNPDVVMLTNPRRRRSPSEPSHIYSFEVEVPDGFSIQSVYQAHATSRGATYGWVVFSREELASPQWKRVERTARELGIGLIAYGKPGAWTTWKTVLKARRRSDTNADRSEFVATVLNPEVVYESAA